MDAGWWGVIVAVVIGAPTLIYAIRATHVSEKVFKFEVRRDREQRRAGLEWTSPTHDGKIWRCMGRTTQNTATCETSVRNRGPAPALDVQWSGIMGANPIRIGFTPNFLYVLHDHQLFIEVPLGVDDAPLRGVIKVRASFNDDEGNAVVQWCLRFESDPSEELQGNWTLVDLDCISLKPRLTTHGFRMALIA